jgi:hypothetical protein
LDAINHEEAEKNNKLDLFVDLSTQPAIAAEKQALQQCRGLLREIISI